MTERLLILGAGGHGKVVADAARLEDRWTEIAFIDDAPPAEKVIGLSVLGGSAQLRTLHGRFTHATVAIGNAARRLALLDELTTLGFSIPVIRHPSASVSRFASVDDGCVLFANSTVNADSRIGRGCIINTTASVDHDCDLAEGVHVAPGANIAGDVSIGKASWIGIGSCVREGVSIGANATVGAGAAVIADVADGAVVVGVPARPLPKREGS